MDRLLDHSFLATVAKDSVARFYRECPQLVAEPALERTKSARLAQIINQQIAGYGFTNGLFADCDYRKSMHAQKELFYQKHNQSAPQTNHIVPDIVLHVPFSSAFNSIVFELKEAAGDRQDDDIEKLKGLTDQEGLYRYQLGVAVQFTLPEPAFKFFVDGQEVSIDA
jgi:hypothetical protein